MSGRAGAAPWFFDAHCDTFLRVVENGADFERSPDLHVTLPGMIEAGVRMQVFAAWTLAERLQGREDEVALQMVEAVKAMCRAHSERFVLVRTRADLQAVAADPTKIGALCALESADPLKGDPSALDFFYDAGVRLVTLVWGDNAFCGATFGSGSGLTDKGRELIARCEDAGSHGGRLSRLRRGVLGRLPSGHEALRGLTQQLPRALRQHAQPHRRDDPRPGGARGSGGHQPFAGVPFPGPLDPLLGVPRQGHERTGRGPADHRRGRRAHDGVRALAATGRRCLWWPTT